MSPGKIKTLKAIIIEGRIIPADTVLAYPNDISFAVAERLIGYGDMVEEVKEKAKQPDIQQPIPVSPVVSSIGEIQPEASQITDGQAEAGAADGEAPKAKTPKGRKK